MICNSWTGRSTLLLACIAMLALSISSASAQVNGPGVSSPGLFTSVIDLPSDGPLSGYSIGGAAGETVQLNVGTGGNVPPTVFVTNSEVNVNGGSIGPLFNLTDSELNFSSGFVDIFDAQNSVVTQTGGEIFNFIATDSVIDISGGSLFFGGGPNSLNNSQLNLFGNQFFIDGVSLDLGGAPLIVNDRDVTLSGILADGSPFSLLLETTNFLLEIPEVLIDSTSTVTVTIVPEPTSPVFLALLSVMGITRRRRS